MSGIIDCEMHIGDEVFVHGYIDEIRNDTIIIRNVGGYFGTSRDEVFYYEEDERGYGTMNEADRKTDNSSEKPNNCEVKNYCDDCLYTDTCDSKEFFYACTSKATISKMEQVEEPQTKYPCDTCANKGDHDGECSNCVSDSEVIKWKTPSHYKPKDEPQTERSE